MVKTFRLSNGVTCVIDERPRSGKVSMLIGMKAGGMHESAEENGLTFLTQASCIGGTKTRSRQQIMDEIESNGGDIESSTGGLITDFQVTAAARHAEKTFDIFADMIRNPVFSAAEVRKTKKHVDQALHQQEEDAAVMAYSKFSRTAFLDQAAGRNPAGTRALIASFTPEQLRKKHAQIMSHPEEIIISFAGDIDEVQARKMLEKHFGDLEKSAQRIKTPQAVFTGGDVREEKDNEQLNLVFGFKAPSFTDQDMPAARMLKEFLSGGMSSTLFQEVRDKRGLVYTIDTIYDPSETSGLFGIYAGAGKGNAGELFPVAIETLGDVVRNGIDQITLDQLRESIIKEKEQLYEGTDGACANNAVQLIAYGRAKPLDEWKEDLARVTSDDIRRVCADMLKDGKYALGALGPLDTMPSPEEIKNMMKAQVEGVVIPPRPQEKQTSRRDFVKSTKKEPPAVAEALNVTVLENGIKIVTATRRGSLSCGVWVGAGSDYETPEINGATHMLEHMPFKGTKTYATGEIDRIVEKELGAALNAETNSDTTAYYFYRLGSEGLPQIVNICGEMVLEAKISQDDFDGKIITGPGGKKTKTKGERDVVIEELKIALDDATDSHADFVTSIAYPDQPHGRGTLGTEKTLRAMTVEQLRAHRDKFYVPNNMVFSVAGPVSHKDVVALVEKKFGHIRAQDFPPLPKADYKGGVSFMEHKSAELCNITLAAEGVSTADPEALAYEALAHIMAGGGSARLYKEVVMKQELSADVGSASWNFRNGGMFAIITSMEQEKIRPFIRTVYDQLRNVCDDLTEKEVEKFKIFLEMNMLAGLERSQSVCEKNAEDTLAYGKPFTIEEKVANIQKLTVEDVKRAARKVLASNPTLSMIVPRKTDRKFLPQLDEVLAMRGGKDSKRARSRKPGHKPA